MTRGATTSVGMQLNAIVRKNAVYQRRRGCMNCCFIVLPIFFIGVLYGLQELVDVILDDRDYRCGCMCVLCCTRDWDQDCRDADASNQCDDSREECRRYDDDECGIQYSDSDQAIYCEIEDPVVWPPSISIPWLSNRARAWRPHVAFFIHADDKSVERNMQERMVRDMSINAVDIGDKVKLEQAGEIFGSAGVIFGSDDEPDTMNYIDSTFSGANLYVVADDCSDTDVKRAVDLVNRGLAAMTSKIKSEIGFSQRTAGRSSCAQVEWLSRTPSEIERFFYCSWEEAKCNATAEEQGTETAITYYRNEDKFGQAFDFKSTNKRTLDVDFWRWDWGLEQRESDSYQRRRVPEVMNMISDAWMKYSLEDDSYRSYLLGTQETPKVATQLSYPLASLLAVLLSTWVAQLLMPLILVQLAEERSKNLKIMMKMHGLGETAYGIVNYLYYLILYVLYIVVFVACGVGINLAIFTRNSYGVLVVFLLLFGNTQMAFLFAISNFFQSSKGCVVFSFLWIFGTGFIGHFLLRQLIPHQVTYLYFIELIPAFAAYRGFYELGEYGFRADYSNTEGLDWSEFDEDNNHMRYVLLALLLEWPMFLCLAWYFEQVVSSGSGVKRHPLFFLGYVQKTKRSGERTLAERTSLNGGRDEQGEAPVVVPLMGSTTTSIAIEDETEEVAAERQRVENMTEEDAARHSIILRDLRKVFPAAEGVPEKVAVRNLSLAVERGEVFGLLGPNGAGKTTAINMLIGFMNATSGEAHIEGLDISRDMKTLYTLMGVCPQHDLLWETLTGFEHMLFYGRLKGLKNLGLKQAAEDALKAVNLFHGGVSKLQVKKYSGGMKRRLSVAISFIGSPRVVYLDEPSTGLDPASRRNLWKIVKQAKQDKAIILTTHNMEEAEVLCDRLGIFVDGRLEVIGNPKSLTQRYGGYLVFTLITVPAAVDRAAVLVRERFPKAVESYRLSGTLKFELPSSSVTPSQVFQFMEASRNKIDVQDWGVATVTLEEVFIKIAKQAGAKTSELP